MLKDLRKLGRTLLPVEVLTADGKTPRPTFLVTPDCCLNQIPFDAFDTAVEGPSAPPSFELRCCLRALRRSRHRNPPVSNGVIVVNPRPSDELQKRFPFQQELEQAAEEGRAMATLDPAATYLEGEVATKAKLQQKWSEASYICRLPTRCAIPRCLTWF